MCDNNRNNTKKHGKRRALALNEEELIRQVELRPILYNRSLKSYRKSGLRLQYWREVGDAMGTTVEECRRRWRSLRDAFAKHLKQQMHHTLPLPDTACVYPKRKKWVFYDQMSFIAPFLDSSGYAMDQQLLDDFGDNSDEAGMIMLPNDDCSGLTSELHDSSSQQLNSVDSVLKSCEDLDNKLLSSLSADVRLSVNTPSSLSELQSQQEHHSDTTTSLGWTMATNSTTATQPVVAAAATIADSDSDEKFLLSCVPVLRRLTNRKNALARLKIQQVLFDVEFGSD